MLPLKKEVDIRRRILREYNKREDDFNSLLEFNDYLEEIEHIILNLANGIDVTETKKKIEVYKRENKEQIDVTKQQQIKEEKQVKKAKIKNKEELLDELTFSNMSAEEIMASHNSKLEEIVPDEIFKEETYRYCERIVDYIGPNPPALEELEPEGYSKHIRKTTKEERAGGFVTDISCHRALQEAFSGLYFVHSLSSSHKYCLNKS
ncbi:CDK-activating kinase assembly factor MAT1 [Nymphon striatum]|nr:CDK-activating kinase assembly factor MAT1 [Nymphon striatum]